MYEITNNAVVCFRLLFLIAGSQFRVHAMLSNTLSTISTLFIAASLNPQKSICFRGHGLQNSGLLDTYFGLSTSTISMASSAGRGKTLCRKPS